MTHLLSQNRLHETLDYSLISGKFYWKIRTSNRITVGSLAGNLNSGGYRQIGIDGVEYYAHRLAVLWLTGSFPEDQTDHLNHDPSFNGWVNLEKASNASNGRNQSKRDGFEDTGVSWHAAARKWRAYITYEGIQQHLGLFIKKQDARSARAAAEIEYRFHPNHGS